MPSWHFCTNVSTHTHVATASHVCKSQPPTQYNWCMTKRELCNSERREQKGQSAQLWIVYQSGLHHFRNLWLMTYAWYHVTVTHSHIIDFTVSSASCSPSNFAFQQYWSDISCYQTRRGWKLHFYRTISLLLVHKDPSSESYKPFYCWTLRPNHYIYLAKLTALDLWVSILRSSLTCSALLIIHTSFGNQPHCLLSLSVCPFICRRNWCWHFTPRPLQHVSTYGSAGWRIRPFTSASTHTILYWFSLSKTIWL